MTVVSNQRRIFLELLGKLRPHLRSDRALPSTLKTLLARDRRFGSRDRRLYRELLYTAVRYLPWIEPVLDADADRAVTIIAWLSTETGDTRSFRASLLDGWPVCPEGIAARADLLDQNPAGLLPQWVAEECPTALAPEELDALHRRGELWLRLLGEGSGVALAELSAEGWSLRPSLALPDAVAARHPDRPESDLTRTEGWCRGALEIQDLGSQMVLESIRITPGERWLDACAGAGGKTLQLSRILGASGKVDAWDPRPAALRELDLRRERAGLRNIGILASAPVPPGRPGRAEYDGVLVDAPCSGSGTWRRAPHLKWVTTHEDVHRHAARQSALLRAHAPLVQPGGQLVYATCSLARRENESVAERFLEAHPDFEAAPPDRDFGFGLGDSGFSILPARHDTDGFHVARFRRKG